jgi:hypothetical protein
MNIKMRKCLVEIAKVICGLAVSFMIIRILDVFEASKYWYYPAGAIYVSFYVCVISRFSINDQKEKRSDR